MRLFPIFFCIIALILSNCSQPRKTFTPSKATDSVPPIKDIHFKQYSNTVADSFSIYIHLPAGYNPQHTDTYPVVYLLDANLYFDIMAVTVRKYSEVGLAPDVILVGVGYKDFQTMDSLRSRDDTYPTAIPEYEMKESGGAENFLTYLCKELGPSIDKDYKTDTNKRILMGHSLAGYFTLYALSRQLTGLNSFFSGFIAASPSLHYNNYYLLSQLSHIHNHRENPKKWGVYTTFGGLEDNATDPNALPLAALNKKLRRSLSADSNFLRYRTDILSNLDHMETQIPTFLKGMQWMLASPLKPSAS